MTPAQRSGQAIVLSGFDMPDAQDLLLHSCEDCACPVSEDTGLGVPGVLPAAAVTGTDQWVGGREVVEIQLDDEHRLLFNPMGHGAVAVVDNAAYEIFRAFRQPATLSDVRLALQADCASIEQAFRQLAQLEMLHPADRTQAPEFRSSKVLTAWLHVTNACNLRCPYCYLDKSGEGMDESTGRAAVRAVIQSAVEHGFPAVKLKYAGGEASMNSRLVADLHAYAQSLAAQHKLRLHATILSNGVVLAPAFMKMLKAEGIRVMISLDGIGARHDAQRPTVNGRPSFQHVERTIKRLIEQDLTPHLSITITNRNVDGIADVVRFALERELTFSINFFRDNDCAASFPDLRYEEQALISSLLDTFAVIEEFMPRWSILGSILDRGQLLRPQQRSCGVGQDYVVIDQRGRVAKCHMEIERTLGDIFSDDPLQLIREDRSTALNLIVDEKEGCKDCTWRYWCSGGCAVATFRATGRYDIKSPNCNIYKAIYPQALRLEGLRLLKYAMP